MKERPILFSAPMVRAILEGRKTQTRRVVKGVALDWLNDGFTPEFVADYQNRLCPYGQPGDRLWVRETFKHCATEWHGAKPDVHRHRISYLADGKEIAHSRPYGDWSGLPNFKDESYWDRRSIPSIHMPRWASRILLEVTDVRVERLQDISEADAAAEGLFNDGDIPFNMPWFVEPQDSQGYSKATDCYAALWERINGDGSWEANPWVWVVEFKRVEGGVQ